MTVKRNAIDELLVAALEQGNAENVTKSIASGANPDLRVEGIPILQFAVISQRPAMVEQLLAGGADVNATNKSGITALMWAGMIGHGEIQRSITNSLLRSGADVNATDDSGRNAIDVAAQFLNAAGVHMLSEAGSQATSAYRRQVEKMLGSMGQSKG